MCAASRGRTRGSSHPSRESAIVRAPAPWPRHPGLVQTCREVSLAHGSCRRRCSAARDCVAPRRQSRLAGPAPPSVSAVRLQVSAADHCGAKRTICARLEFAPTARWPQALAASVRRGASSRAHGALVARPRGSSPPRVDSLASSSSRIVADTADSNGAHHEEGQEERREHQLAARAGRQVGQVLARLQVGAEVDALWQG